MSPEPKTNLIDAKHSKDYNTKADLLWQSLDDEIIAPVSENGSGSKEDDLWDQIDALIVVEAKDLAQGESLLDYNEWAYKGDSYSNPRYDVSFDDLGLVRKITCYSNCGKILDVGIGAFEEDIKERLGIPSVEQLHMGEKTLTYRKLNLEFSLARKKVDAMSLTTNE